MTDASKTPETDAIFCDGMYGVQGDYTLAIDLARRLERERDAALKDAEELAESARVWSERALRAEDRCCGRTQERDEALAALRRYRNEVPLGHQPHMLAHEVDALLARIDDARRKG